MARKKKVVTQPTRKPDDKKTGKLKPEESKRQMRNPVPKRTRLQRGNLEAVIAGLLSEVDTGTIPAKGPYTVTLSISKKSSATVKRIPKKLTFELE